MASADATSLPLKARVSRVKHFLADANRRLLDEASRYEIFTTKTSAVGGGSATTILSKTNGVQQHQYSDIPSELRRNINDVSILQSVISCPIFDRIVNVTDSLDKLSYHLNLRPSLGPDDIDINADGELILTPPIEPTMLNNFINSKLDEYSDHAANSPHLVHPDFLENQSDNQGNFANGNNGDQIEHIRSPLKYSMGVQQCQGPSFVVESKYPNGTGSRKEVSGTVEYQRRVETNNHLVEAPSNGHRTFEQNCEHPRDFVPSLSPPNDVSSHPNFNTEKLITTNGESSKNNSSSSFQKQRENNGPTRVDEVRAVFEPTVPNEGQRLYKANGNFALNQMIPTSETHSNLESPRPLEHVNENMENSKILCYSNDLYKTTQDVQFTQEVLNDNQLLNQGIKESDHKDIYINSMQENRNTEPVEVVDSGPSSSEAQQIVTKRQPNRGSPSTSDGSTVRLADESDSGTSSFRSQAAKLTQYSPQFQQKSDADPIDSSIDQELIDELLPEMEEIKVKLERDDNSLGITVAGYTCEQEEISGIFIKSITPGSPADKSGKIRILDRIFSVNDHEILNYSNPEAVNFLRRQTGKVVTLGLMRYHAESKYRKLQTLLDRATPTADLQNNPSLSPKGRDLTSVAVSPAKSMIPLPESKIDSNRVSAKLSSTVSQRKQLFESNQRQEIEAIYKNTESAPANHHEEQTNSLIQSSFNKTYDNLQSNMPVAAQRIASSRVIETKLGARNTIDIKSPVCQTAATATYINNKQPDFDISVPNRYSASHQTDKSNEGSEDFERFVRSKELKWHKDVEMIDLYKDPSQGLGFSVKEYANPSDRERSIIMITSLTPGSVADRDERLSIGDLLIFVDDTNLEGACLQDSVKALKKASGQVRLGVLKLIRD